MQTETIAFAPFEAHHLDGAVALSREAGWPQEDWAMIWSLSEGRVALDGYLVEVDAIAVIARDAPAGTAGNSAE